MSNQNYLNGVRYYRFPEVISLFRERIDPNISKEEINYILDQLKFHRGRGWAYREGEKTPCSIYNPYKIKELLTSGKSLVLDKLSEKRSFEILLKVGAFNRNKTVDMGKSDEELAEIAEKNRQRNHERYEAERKEREKAMRRYLADMERKERRSPYEDMDYVSDELLRNDDVYTTRFNESVKIIRCAASRR